MSARIFVFPSKADCITHDDFVLQPGLTSKTECEILLSAMNVVSKDILKACTAKDQASMARHIQSANQIMSGVTKALDRIRRERGIDHQ